MAALAAINDPSIPESPLNYLKEFFLLLAHYFEIILKLEKGETGVTVEELLAMSKATNDGGNYISQIIIPDLQYMLDRLSNFNNVIVSIFHDSQ
ncbi:hypothetical protein MTP99_012870 [Tenebrio molitor]|jgi:hypothetical protein|nr:hypothetical protein MTP99_012870 [Tenebrio molitor]